MKSMLPSALLGMAAGLIAIAVVILLAIFGPAASGGPGESLMGASILLTRIGGGTSLMFVSMRIFQTPFSFLNTVRLVP
ncbi:MAG: hypothetical protein ACJ796_05120 [Gemmatimonadaceae bacterium]